MNTNKIHVIEDEADIAELIRFNLSAEGFEVTSSESGEEGLREVQKNKPDLVILDLMLPRMSGLEICRNLKDASQTKNIPVIMVTAKGEEQDVIRGLEFGADDYITKPFSPKVLVARVRAVLRRGLKTDTVAEIVKAHEVLIHPGRHEVLIGDEKIDLTHSEFQILHFLAQRPGWVFTRSQIVDAIRGQDYAVTDRSIDVQMVGLRRKLKTAGQYIETVRSVGYRFKESTA